MYDVSGGVAEAARNMSENCLADTPAKPVRAAFLNGSDPDGLLLALV